MTITVSISTIGFRGPPTDLPGAPIADLQSKAVVKQFADPLLVHRLVAAVNRCAWRGRLRLLK